MQPAPDDEFNLSVGVDPAGGVVAPSEQPLVLELSDDSFDSAVMNNGLMLVDFWAPWCSPCIALTPLLEEIARDNAGKVVLGKLNIDENPVTPSKLGVQGIPTIFITRNGEVLDYFVGAIPKADLMRRVSPFL
jgi:thioredoxin